ncbi:methionyl-tRNA formyltransferase [Vibrio aquimaris]|uniref:Bifunctional polymyxin resistance protein ArnA n=1 Tax=Vibrio aquimaris TaxID=2587862 RepID=A0A5P9CG68_9VIBR|nr:methionyl-tRNA formyltransferase [Vibrio aquimaris]QFT24853.1 Bifunctional polymyxin resistance protein ArnA [Vibrio aquimaris]
MKIGYFADGPWSHLALEKIVELKNVDVAFITPRFDTQDPVLKDWSERLNVPYILHENVNSKEYIEHVSSLNADLFISMSFNQILKKEIINIPPMGFINCHAGDLPYYRGRNPLNWVLINDEPSYGITVHMVDEGIDTGDIVLKRSFEITDSDTYKTLLESAIFNCSKVLIESIELIINNKVNLIKQKDIHPVGFYCGMRRHGDESISFDNDSRTVFNFIRAITSPGPGARACVNGEEVAILTSELIDNAPSYIATVGEVVGKELNGVVVKTSDSTILITQVASIDSDGSLFNIRIPKYRIGTRFKSL